MSSLVLHLIRTKRKEQLKFALRSLVIAFIVPTTALANGQWVQYAQVDGCIYSYRTPLILHTRTHIGFWGQVQCPKENTGEVRGQKIQYTVTQSRIYLNCRRELLWVENEIYYDKNGRVVSTWSPTIGVTDIDGPYMEKNNLLTVHLVPDHQLRRLTDTYCK